MLGKGMTSLSEVGYPLLCMGCSLGNQEISLKYRCKYLYRGCFGNGMAGVSEVDGKLLCMVDS